MKAEENLQQKVDQVSPDELAKLVVMQNQVLGAETAQELAIFACNESHNLSPYFQAISWHKNLLNNVEIMAVSGVSHVEKNAIIVHFMVNLVKAILAMEDGDKAKVIGQNDISGGVRDDWLEMMPPHCHWLPYTQNDRTEAGLLVFYEYPINRKRQTLFEPLISTYTHVWYSLPENKTKEKGVIGRFMRSSLNKWISFFVVCAILAIPVRESALAPARVVATKPTVVGATVKGVIKEIHVPPNEYVNKGDLLVSLDATEAVSGLEIAETELESARTEFLITSQRAFNSEDAKSEVSLLKSKADAAELKVKQARSLLQRTRVYASRSGVAIYTDKYEFLGKSIDIGQRIMLLADVNDVEMNISMPVGDTIDFTVGDEVSFFLNTDPVRPVKAKLRQTSYEPQTDDAGEFVFKMKATFDDQEFKARIGWAGTAKIYSSDKLSLFMYMFRRPISSVRRWFGW